VKEPLDFQAQVRAHKSFWDDISKLLHARLVEPDVRVMVSGTMESPQGTVTVHIPEVQWLLAEPDEEFPPLKNVEGRIVLDRQRARVERLSLLVEEQPVTAQGDVPFYFGKELRSGREVLSRNPPAVRNGQRVGTARTGIASAWRAAAPRRRDAADAGRGRGA